MMADGRARRQVLVYAFCHACAVRKQASLAVLPLVLPALLSALAVPLPPESAAVTPRSSRSSPAGVASLATPGL